MSRSVLLLGGSGRLGHGTSRLPAPIVAAELALALRLEVEGVLHIGGPRKQRPRGRHADGRS